MRRLTRRPPAAVYRGLSRTAMEWRPPELECPKVRRSTGESVGYGRQLHAGLDGGGTRAKPEIEAVGRVHALGIARVGLRHVCERIINQPTRCADPAQLPHTLVHRNYETGLASLTRRWRAPEQSAVKATIVAKYYWNDA